MFSSVPYFVSSTTIPSSVGLMVVVTITTVTTTTGVGRRRRTVTTTKSDVNYGTGFIIDGETENGLLLNRNNSQRPIVASVAHIIPESGQNRYFVKFFDRSTKISKIHELDLLCYNRGIDVCLFDFKTPFSQENPPVCIQWDISELSSGDICYLVGYPMGDSQQSIVQGSIRDPTYCFSNLSSGVDQIYHSAPATKGNSGSCILNSEGKIIGIHAWAYNQMNSIEFENFCGGPSTHSIFNMISYMMNNLGNEKFFSRVCLGVKAKIIDDIFRIVKMDLPILQQIDGIIIEQIGVQKTIDIYNKGIGVPKIEVNDIITHINDLSNNYVSIGYTKESPVNLLFNHPSNIPLKIKIRKSSENYSNEIEIFLNNCVLIQKSEDVFYSNLI
jgi:hypothetical protein